MQVQIDAFSNVSPLKASTSPIQEQSNLSRFVPTHSTESSEGVWGKIKNAFSSETALTPLLKETPENIVKNWDVYLPTIQEALWSLLDKRPRKLTNELGILLNNLVPLAPDHIHQLLDSTMQRAISSNHPHHAMICVDLIGVQSLISIATQKGLLVKSTKELSNQIVRDLPELPPKHWIRVAIESECKRLGFIVFNFFSNLLDTIFRAFSFFDDGKWPATYWEYNTLLDIYVKVFLIPYLIFVTIKPILAISSQAYLVTAGIVGVLGVAIFAYARWIRPRIQSIPWLQDLVKNAERGNLTPVVEIEDNVNKVINHLCQPSKTRSKHLLIVGPTGAGKTSLVQAAAQRIASYKSNPNVPSDLKNIDIKQINTSQFISGDMDTGHTQKLSQIRNELKRCAIKPFVFFDEFADAFKNHEFGKALIAELDSDYLRCIGAMTDVEWDELKNKHPSLKDRFQIMHVTYPTPHLLTNILQEIFSKNFPEIYITDEAFDIVVRDSKKCLSNPNESPLRASKDLLNNLVTKFKMSWKQPYNPPQLDNEIATLNRLKAHYKQRSSEIPLWENSPEACKIEKEIEESIRMINHFELKLKTKQVKFKHLTSLIDLRKKVVQDKQEIARSMDQWYKKNKTVPKELEKAMIFYHYLFIPSLSKQCSNEMDELELPKQIDGQFVNEFLKTHK